MSADFDSWSKESLVMFAKDTTERMAQQRDEIVELRADLRAAIDAYRALVTRGEISRQPSASP